jgi:hypothetical protein
MAPCKSAVSVSLHQESGRCPVFQSPALGIDVPAQARQQAPDSTKFPALTQVAVFQNIILHLVDYIALASDDISQNIGKVLDEVDDEGQGAWDGQALARAGIRSEELIHFLARTSARLKWSQTASSNLRFGSMARSQFSASEVPSS